MNVSDYINERRGNVTLHQKISQLNSKIDATNQRLTKLSEQCTALEEKMSTFDTTWNKLLEPIRKKLLELSAQFGQFELSYEAILKTIVNSEE